MQKEFLKKSPPEESKPEVRLYRPGEDDERIALLFNQVFEEKITPALWRHKYAESPAGGWAFLTFIGEELVSVSGWPARWFILQEERHRIVSMSDVMVHPAWRGRFGGRLGSMARPLWEEIFEKEKIPLAVGFPNPKHYLVGKRFVRAKDLGAFEVGVETFSRLWRVPALAELIRRLYAVKSRSQPLEYREIKPSEDGKIPPWAEEGLSLLWEKVARGFKVAYVKDLESLKWRYFKWEALSPKRTRRFFLLERKGPLGFIVLREVYLGPIKGFELEEILCAQEDAKALFEGARSLALKAGGHFLRYVLSPALGLKAKVIERKAPSLWRPFAYRGEVEALEKRLSPAKWHLTLGDMAV